MRRADLIRYTVIACTLMGIAAATETSAVAQNPIEDAIKQLSSDNVRGYLQPLVTSLGANMNSGVYHTASIGELGLTLRLDIVGMGTMIGDAEKTCSAVAPYPFDETPVQTASLFGGQGTILNGPGGTQYEFQNGQISTNWVALGTPQLTVGDIFGTQAVVRYVPIPKIQKFPKTTLIGIGIRHSISRYIPMLPLDIAASAFYQKLSIGDLMEAKAFNAGIQASKSFSILTLYGGLQVESSTMDVSYTYNGYGATHNTHVDLSIDGENKFRGTAGLWLDLFVMHVGADVNVGKVTVVSGSVTFGS